MKTENLDLELVFVSGPRTGERVSAADGVVTLGSGEDNSLVVPSAAAHQVSISRGEEGWVMQAGPGTTLNDADVSGRAAKLEDNDVIGAGGARIAVSMRPPLGTVIFKPVRPEASAVARAPEEEAVPPPPPPPPPPGGQTVFAAPAGGIFEAPPPPPSAPGAVKFGPLSRNSPWFWIIIGICLLAAVAALAVRTVLPGKPAAGSVRTEPFEMVLRYSREIVTSDNVFCYTFLLDGKRSRLTLDDFASGRSVNLELPELPQEKLREFYDAVNAGGFFALQDQSGREDVRQLHERRRVFIATAERSHEVGIINDMPPDAFATVERLIDSLALEFKVPQATAMTAEEVKAQALEAFMQARSAAEDVRGNSAKYLEAINGYKLAILYFERFENRPREYAEATDALSKLEKDRELRIRELKEEITRQSNLGDAAAIRDALLELRVLYPENSPENEKIRGDILKIETRLQGRRRR